MSPTLDNSVPIADTRRKIIELALPGVQRSITDILDIYPPRELNPSALVTRVAPSPTGYMHIGTLYVALISERIAHQSGGIFYLRIEDTDKAREVNGAIELILSSLRRYNTSPDEYVDNNGNQIGEYGPYKQSQRGDIYQVFVKHLLENGQAYVCFSTGDELDAIRKIQEEQGINPGYYGNWAKWRHQDDNVVLKELEEGSPFTIRLRSHGNSAINRVKYKDLVKGIIELPENDKDIVILKSDGLPTYHFAHVIDDYLMGTSHVIRGDEWLSSLPVHLELFNVLGLNPPSYAHIAPIQKMEGTSRKKLSKRSHPEASLEYYEQEGYPTKAVIEYLLNLIDSNFEDWRKDNPNKDYTEFTLNLDKLGGTGGSLLDFEKLDNISKNVISKYKPDVLLDLLRNWAKRFNTQLYVYIDKYPDYILSILSIERGENAQRERKDIAKIPQLASEILFCLDEEYNIDKKEISQLFPEQDIPNLIQALKSYKEVYLCEDTNESWFKKIKSICQENNIALSQKQYDKNPGMFHGSIVHFTNLIRFVLTGKTQTKDLYQIMRVMGHNRVYSRLSSIF